MNEANPFFRLKLQLCGCDTLTGIGMGGALAAGSKHPAFYVGALLLIVLAGLGARSLRQRLKTAPALNQRQRRIIFGWYAAPWALFIFLVAALFLYIHAETRLWVIFLFPALFALSIIVMRYRQIYED